MVSSMSMVVAVIGAAASSGSSGSGAAVSCSKSGRLMTLLMAAPETTAPGLSALSVPSKGRSVSSLAATRCK
jgi:hypothetical protein